RHGVLSRLLFHGLHGTVEVTLGDGALPALHDRVDEARDNDAVEFRVRHAFAAGDESFTRHDSASSMRRPCAALPYFDFVPYFERLFLRPLTPLASSVPRTML